MEPTVESLQGAAPLEPRLLSLGRKDAERVLEVYVRRSLSLTDGPGRDRKPRGRGGDRKGATTLKGEVRRSISELDSLGPSREVSKEVKVPGDPKPSESPARSVTPLERSTEKPKKVSKKGKKSVLKSLFSYFWKKGSEEKEDQEPASEEKPAPVSTQSQGVSASCLPVTRQLSEDQYTPTTPRPAKPLKRKSTLRKTFSFKSRGTDAPKKPTFLALRGTVHKQDAPETQPRYSYYEQLSVAMEDIVKAQEPVLEEMFQSAAPPAADIETDGGISACDQVLIEKIVSLLQREGDGIDEKLKESTALNSFFQGMTYSSFQQLADLYVETSEVMGQQPQVSPPELVKFAFTLDITAKVAGLCNHTVNRIMGFGNQYLQDRFTQFSNDQPRYVGDYPVESPD
ncbi:apoptosis facilitator Bcl-2-like protein 14 [Acipenser ruthenus]|uniref:apoptosis facilitator Bcl-2-like protein 14 n=1 Tax=Acipenser ruthenus TaxID=7906 RepID=UPI00274265BD|nr:apoptosis facilitator Bcl-2-like protein 14 [Acipenser ruthenus]XP_058860714.1 apoptosis facilitator Bcl-2-like protein 14 [Acipenser ruthenus]